MDHLLFCVNHEEKIAKKHCKQCDQNLCNECVFDLHIEHHTEIDKIEYSMDTKQVKYSQILSEEINAVVEKTMKELKPKISQLILEKTEEYIKSHKNLQLKLNQPKEKKPPLKEEKQNEHKIHTQKNVQPPVKDNKMQHPAKENKIQNPAKENKIQNPAKENKIQHPAKENKIQPPAKENKIQPPVKETKNTLQNQVISEKPKPKINDRSKMFEPKKEVFKKEETKKIIKKKIGDRAKMFEQNMG